MISGPDLSVTASSEVFISYGNKGNEVWVVHLLLASARTCSDEKICSRDSKKEKSLDL